jgi:hypothetical protein
VLWAVAPRRAGVQVGQELAAVQMPPGAFLGVVVDAQLPIALRAAELPLPSAPPTRRCRSSRCGKTAWNFAASICRVSSMTPYHTNERNPGKLGVIFCKPLATHDFRRHLVTRPTSPERVR